jgi:hypothetical protein
VDKIAKFLKSHPLISYNGIGVSLGLRDGQLRPDRAIPKKFVVEIERVLMGYGYVPDNWSKDKSDMDERHNKLIDETLSDIVSCIPDTIGELRKIGREVSAVPEKLKQYPVEPVECEFSVAVKTHEVRNGHIGVVETNLFKRVILDDGDYFVKKL